MNDKNVIWDYVDTNKATIKAIEDYPKMKKLELILSYDNVGMPFNQFRRKKNSEFLEWFEPAWNSIDTESRTILTEFYMKGNLKSGAGIRLQFELSYSERQLHRMRAKALEELSILLYAK